MAQPTNTFDIADLIGDREQLDNTIHDISPVDCQFQKMIGDEKATAINPEWQTDALAAADTANAAIDGDDVVGTAITPTVRIGNRVQISDKGVTVSHQADEADKAGRKKEFAREVAKKTKELKRDKEAIFCQNQATVIGTSSVAAKLGSLEACISTNSSRGTGGSDGGISGSVITAATDGTQRAFTESMLTSMISDCYIAGGEPSVLMVGPKNKQTVSGFTFSTTRQDKSEDRKVTAAIDIIASDYGDIKVVPNRFQRDRSAFLLQPDMWKVMHFRKTKFEPLGKTGHSHKGMVSVHYTLKACNEASSAVIADLTVPT